MSLYQEIIFLDNYYKGKYVVENVIPFYEPLIPAQKRGRHLYWTNFQLPNDLKDRRFAISQAKNELKGLCDFHDYNFTKYKGSQSVIKMARNLVDYEAGLTIFNTARGIIQKSNTTQTELF
jgi:DNA (cytosine-5)-methyltransferase 1